MRMAGIKRNDKLHAGGTVVGASPLSLGYATTNNIPIEMGVIPNPALLQL